MTRDSRLRLNSRPVQPDAPGLADAAAHWRSAYVHIPFCASRCPYCDFAVVTLEEGGTDDTAERYVQEVIAEIALEPAFGPIDAVNFGGGTGDPPLHPA